MPTVASADSTPAAPSAPSPIAQRPREPQGKWATTVPDVSEYSSSLAPAAQKALTEFQKSFPGVDPTQTQDFYATVLAKRRTLGTELTDAKAVEFSAWISAAEAMRGSLVKARGDLVGIAISGTDERGRSFALSGFEGVWPTYIFTQNVEAAITGYGMRYPGELLDGSTPNPRNAQLQVRSTIGSTSLGGTDSNTNRGVYTSDSAAWDQVMWDYPYYIEFYAAGNDGDTGAVYATLRLNEQISKNITTVGNVWDVERDAAGSITNGGTIFGSSSRGPALDGRIKPDLCGNGAIVKSTTLTGSASLSGTPMATPNVAGSTALLLDYYGKRFPGHFMRSSTIRATLAWIDPPGTGQWASDATHAPALVNNLNLRVVGPNGVTSSKAHPIFPIRQVGRKSRATPAPSAQAKPSKTPCPSAARTPNASCA